MLEIERRRFALMGKMPAEVTEMMKRAATLYYEWLIKGRGLDDILLNPGPYFEQRERQSVVSERKPNRWRYGSNLQRHGGGQLHGSCDNVRLRQCTFGGDYADREHSAGADISNSSYGFQRIHCYQSGHRAIRQRKCFVNRGAVARHLHRHDQREQHHRSRIDQ